MAKQANIVSFDEARRNARRLQRTDMNPAVTGSWRAARKNTASFDPVFADDEFDNPALKFKTSDIFADVDDDFAAQSPRAAVEQMTADEEDKAGITGFFAKRKRERNKAKAERAFDKAYGSSDSVSFGASSRGGAQADAAGPRAALYKGQMGSKQKRATRLQSASGTSGVGAGVSFSSPVGFQLPDIPRKLSVSLGILATIALFVGMLYTPTQQFYHQMRDRDRLNAEYQALIDRNITLQEIVDNLQTEEGVEDKAHAEFGYVKEGEQAGSVTGIDVVSSSKFQANIAPGSVPAPETWYSGVLDFLFAYSR